MKGAQAKYVYYDIPKYLDGYSIHGNYTIEGEKVSLAGKLFKGNTAVGNTFQLKGGKDPAARVKLILAQVLNRPPLLPDPKEPRSSKRLLNPYFFTSALNLARLLGLAQFRKPSSSSTTSPVASIRRVVGNATT